MKHNIVFIRLAACITRSCPCSAQPSFCRTRFNFILLAVPHGSKRQGILCADWWQQSGPLAEPGAGLSKDWAKLQSVRLTGCGYDERRAGSYLPPHRYTVGHSLSDIHGKDSKYLWRSAPCWWWRSKSRPLTTTNIQFQGTRRHALKPGETGIRTDAGTMVSRMFP